MPKVLVANRGEIAIRVLRSAAELGWNTVAVYTGNDSSHASFAEEAVTLDSVADFLDVDAIVQVAVNTQCTHIHPGYGFLSENPALPLALAATSSIIFVGPSPDALRVSSDKMLSRDLASSLGVNTAAGIRVSSAADVKNFAKTIGFPVMIKALDGGGGRGIRVVESEGGVEEAFKRCLGESPSKQIFAEKALTGVGWKHIEVQIIGDGIHVNHLWERECSVQRRFQKIVESAPSRLPRSAIQPLLDASLKIANHLKYKGLGTFEYLVNTQTQDWVFLEINPRIQVEHTITEEISDADLVRAQLLLFTPNATLASVQLSAQRPLPSSYSIQLRLTAEDPAHGFQLSPGPIYSGDLSWPAGRGVRVDTWLTSGPYAHNGVVCGEWEVRTDFDSLLAKVIVRGRTFEEATAKARRALRELNIGRGIKTNLSILAGVVDHPEWAAGTIDTLWLERNAPCILKLGDNAGASIKNDRRDELHVKSTKLASSSALAGNTVLLQPGTLFNLALAVPSPTPSANPPISSSKHSLTLISISQNAFPLSLSGTLQSSLLSAPLEFTLTQSTSAAISSGAFEFADLNNEEHIPFPITGKIVELHPALSVHADSERRRVRKGEPLLIMSVMKMETVLSVPFDGTVKRIGKGIKLGMVLGEGMLVCVLGKDVQSRL